MFWCNTELTYILLAMSMVLWIDFSAKLDKRAPNNADGERIKQNSYPTRKHSSRMHTAHLLTRKGREVPSWHPLQAPSFTAPPLHGTTPFTEPQFMAPPFTAPPFTDPLHRTPLHDTSLSWHPCHGTPFHRPLFHSTRFHGTPLHDTSPGQHYASCEQNDRQT